MHSCVCAWALAQGKINVFPNKSKILELGDVGITDVSGKKLLGKVIGKTVSELSSPHTRALNGHAM